MIDKKMMFSVDDLAQEIRRNRAIRAGGAGALAEALMPFIVAHLPKANEQCIFVMDGVTVEIHGDRDSLDRVMGRIYETSDRLGNYVKPDIASVQSLVAALSTIVIRHGDKSVDGQIARDAIAHFMSSKT